MEVPTVPFFVEKTVDIPVPCGGGGRSDNLGTAQAPAPAVEYISPAPAVFQSRALTGDSSVSCASACCGVHIARASSDPMDSASGGVWFSPGTALNSAWWSTTSPSRRFSPRTALNSVSWSTASCSCWFFPGQRSTAFRGAEHNDHDARGWLDGGGPQDCRTGQSSTARRGGPQDFLAGQRSSSLGGACLVQKVELLQEWNVPEFHNSCNDRWTVRLFCAFAHVLVHLRDSGFGSILLLAIPPAQQQHTRTTHDTHTNNNNLVRLRIDRRGASTPLWGVKSRSLPSLVAQPNPSCPALCRQNTTSPWSTDCGGNI